MEPENLERLKVARDYRTEEQGERASERERMPEYCRGALLVYSVEY